MEIVQNIFLEVIWMCEDLTFVRSHGVHIGRVEKEVYDSSQTIVSLIRLILLFELLPSNTTRSLSGDAYMNQNPEKGLEIMHCIVEKLILMTVVLLIRQNFTTSVWWGTLDVH